MAAEISTYDRYRAVILAALDFNIDRLAGQFVCDGYDGTKEHFLSQKQKTEAAKNPYQLQQQLATLAENTRPKDETALTAYVKEKTGLDLENFEEWQNREQARAAARKKPEETRTEQKLLWEKDGVRHIQIRVSTGPKPDHLEEQEAISPDGKVRLRVVQWAKGESASTYVTLIFPTASGGIYSIEGIREDVRAHWQDNDTIIVETPKGYQPYIRHHEIRSGTHVVHINYVEY